MDAIRKKMETLKSETGAAKARVAELEDMVEKDNMRAQAHTDTMINMHRRSGFLFALANPKYKIYIPDSIYQTGNMSLRLSC